MIQTFGVHRLLFNFDEHGFGICGVHDEDDDYDEYHDLSKLSPEFVEDINQYCHRLRSYGLSVDNRSKWINIYYVKGQFINESN